uniref:Tubulin/FtsZ GTPase domain-containing protein n=1 Tax=Mucochytrium quahogii TaxID=96639 RepID=A0A7S2W2H7_9STRA
MRDMYFRSNASMDEEEQVVLAEMETASQGAKRRMAPPKSKKASRVARSILVDMEPRVIDQCIQNRKKWRYDPANCFTFEGGSGNNWAQGYAKHGSSVSNYVIEIARREAERCDAVGGFLLLQSVAGGTGSGLGTYLTEQIADEFPNVSRVNGVVWPYARGEVVVQNYNTLLTLSTLNETSDCVVSLFNDQAAGVCTRLEKIEKPEMKDLNTVFSRDLASSFLLPAVTCGNSHPRWVDSYPLSVASQGLCMMPGLKLIQVGSLPRMAKDAISFSNNSWPSLFKQLWGGRNHILGTRDSPMLHSLKGIVTFRGTGARSFALDQNKIDNGYLELLSNRGPLLRYDESISTIGGHDKTISLASNSLTIAGHLNRVVSKAHLMFSNNAYVHQYTCHGLELETMKSSFLTMEQVIHNYETAT